MRAHYLFEMTEKKLFKNGLILSAAVHAVIIGLLSIPHPKLSIFPKPVKTIEITYQTVKQIEKKDDEATFKDLSINKSPRPPEKQKVEVLSKNDNMFSTIGSHIKDLTKLSGQLLAGQKKSGQISMLDASRKITLPPIGTTKITNPKYITYNDDMREAISRNIKQRAYTYVNHPDFEAGQVYLTFVLASNGMLRQLQIIENKTAANDYLRRVALKSIQESSPFPPFPAGFDYPEFTFNLLISFQD